ncbi:serine hydrolase FSH [Hypoxylon sp. FL1150]|nr:serine hydrolase FSH [Hypoxylon sp. FL1150]
MRFLCLHGSGTNSKIFETQTAAIRYSLGDGHTYEFVEGTMPAAAAPEIKELVSPTDELFSYINLENMESCVSALANLDSYIATEGPFDAVLAFSQGAMIAASYITWKLRQNPALERKSPTFKCAVFFSAWSAYDPDALWKGKLRVLTPSVDGEIIHIPTAHIWGRNDKVSIKASDVSGLCAAGTRQVHVHEGGHEVPGARMSHAVKSSVRIIRRVISSAGEINRDA